VSKTILERVADGDAMAVEECLNEYGGLVWSLARRLSSNLTDAEDAVQEVFIDLWKSAARYDASIASETTFIAMIARRRLIDRRRKAGRQMDVAALPEESAIPGTADADRLEICEEAQKAREGLKQLRTDERRVLELSIYDGLTQAQIAEQTDLPLGTVKTHARRGLIRLRQALGENASDRVAGGLQK
jgi:RNA polymerase sigma-70 factor (ECF subfamily)